MSDFDDGIVTSTPQDGETHYVVICTCGGACPMHGGFPAMAAAAVIERAAAAMHGQHFRGIPSTTWNTEDEECKQVWRGEAQAVLVAAFYP